MSSSEAGSDDGRGRAGATLLERMTAAGIGEDRARGCISRGVVRLAGEPITAPDTVAPWPTRWVIGPE